MKSEALKISGVPSSPALLPEGEGNHVLPSSSRRGIEGEGWAPHDSLLTPLSSLLTAFKTGKLMRSLIVLSLALSLAACGFHLRGPSNIPFATMYVKGPQYSPFVVQLKRAITAGSHTKLVDDPKQAEAILDIAGEQRWVQILTLTSGGRVGEYTLHYTISFRLYNNKNQQFLPPTSIALHRQLTFNDAVVLAKTAEENMLYKNMQTDAVQQMVRRLEAVKVKS